MISVKDWLLDYKVRNLAINKRRAVALLHIVLAVGFQILAEKKNSTHKYNE